MRTALLCASALFLAAPAMAHPDVTPEDRLVHDSMLVLDTHLDTPMLFERPGWDFGALNRYEYDGSQVDLPRMAEGGLDGGFFVIYLGQGELNPAAYAEARDRALLRAAAIQRVIAANSDRIALATTADDAERLHREGKKIAFQSIENSWPLGEDLSLLTTFHRLGVRMAGPVHSRNNQFADSTTDTPRWRGLSPLGRRWVAEMNRLGMLIDASHSSDAAFDQMLELSQVPIVLSHSGPKAIFDHPRNIDDDRLRRLAAKGGVMFINSIFLVAHDSSPERQEINRRHANWHNLDAQQRRQLLADRAALDAQRPYTTADFDLHMRSLLHSVRVMGVDHVGLGADWDGGGGVIGMEDVTALPRITARLRREGFSEADIAKIMGGNLLRVMRQAEAFAAQSRP
ncbi:MAG: dipeptidase [Allosphingosinicella sp.]|uniref:dipeptidase n=1 Tax=Allosphingosinicella sp. TaxID=2823234 RepID=UPI003943D5DC